MPEYCKKWIEYVGRLLATEDYDEVVDIGCGDWQVTEALKEYFPKNTRYTGVDVVNVHPKELESEQFRFVQTDFSVYDNIQHLIGPMHRRLFIVKDVLRHWPDDKVETFLNNICNYAAFTGDTLLIANNWRYIRAPKPIPNPRVLDRYHWCPIDLTDDRWRMFDLELVLYYPRKEKMVMRRDF